VLRFSLKTDYQNVFAIGDVTEIKVNENVAIPKAGVFAGAQAKVVSQQIVDDIENNKNKLSSSSKFDGKGFCFMEVGDKKAGYLAAYFYNEHGPATLLEPPSEESYKIQDLQKSIIPAKRIMVKILIHLNVTIPYYLFY
jgi:sulfide:quinone oxidoreductase